MSERRSSQGQTVGRSVKDSQGQTVGPKRRALPLGGLGTRTAAATLSRTAAATSSRTAASDPKRRRSKQRRRSKPSASIDPRHTRHARRPFIPSRSTVSNSSRSSHPQHPIYLSHPGAFIPSRSTVSESAAAGQRRPLLSVRPGLIRPTPGSPARRLARPGSSRVSPAVF